MRLVIPPATRATASALALTLVCAVPRASIAQGESSAFDPRWTAWLGCWQSEDVRDTQLTCVVPSASSSGIDVLSIAGGKIVARRSLVADARSRRMDETGCDGTRSAQWGRRSARIYVRASYACDGTPGVLSSLLTLTTDGEWLEVESVRAGDGLVQRVNRLQDAGIPGNAPAEVVRAIAGRRLAISTARAAAAAPSSVNDVLEALRFVDSTTVRNWLVESRQRFSVNGSEASELMRTSVPRSVMQAVLSGDQPRVVADAGSAGSNAVLSAAPTFSQNSSLVTYPMYEGWWRFCGWWWYRAIIVPAVVYNYPARYLAPVHAYSSYSYDPYYRRGYSEYSYYETPNYYPQSYGYYPERGGRAWQSYAPARQTPQYQGLVGVRGAAQPTSSWGPAVHVPAGRPVGRRP